MGRFYWEVFRKWVLGMITRRNVLKTLLAIPFIGPLSKGVIGGIPRGNWTTLSGKPKRTIWTQHDRGRRLKKDGPD